MRDEAELRAVVARVTRAVAARVGKRSDLAAIVAAEVAAALEPSPRSAAAPSPAMGKGQALERVELCASCLEEERRKRGKRAVVTTTGKNAKGIVAKIAQAIADAGGDILDISQTLVSDFFTMIIIVDTTGLEIPFAEFKTRLTGAVGALGAECLVMHEEVVTALQRV